MATTSSGGTATSFSNTPQAQDDSFTSALINGLNSAITEDTQAVMYLDVMANDLGGNAKTLWSLDDGISDSVGTKTYAPADLLVQDDKGGIIDSTPDYSANGARIWITADGKVGYDSATLSTAFKASLQALSVGEVLKDSFTYAIRLGNGTLSWATAQVVFSGANDAVTLSTASISSGTVTEDAPLTTSSSASASPSGTLNTSGSIVFHDVDAHDHHSASFAPAAGNSTTLGSFVLAPVNEGTGTTNGNVNWSYTLNNAAAQYLAGGQIVTETYVVTINDGHGSVVTQNVTITIVGTNDAAVITGTSTAALTESNVAQSTGGTLSATDVDSSAAFVVQTNVDGNHGYGKFSIDAGGHWNYTMNNAHDEFVAGTTYTDSFTVTTADGTAQVVTVSILGSNDAAVITGTSTAALTESNVAQSTGGTLSATDVDSSAAFVVQTNVDGNHGYGKFSIDAGGHWNYTMNNAHDEFVAGTTYTDSFTVTTADGTAQVITVSILGTNDAAVITGTSTAALTESNVAQGTGGTLSATDVDSSAAFVVQTSVDGNHGYGKFSIDAGGHWNYTMNNAHDEFVAGTTYTDSFTVTTADGTAQVITVSILGTNDAPLIDAANTTASGAVSEGDDGSSRSTSGVIAYSDVDASDSHSFALQGTAATYGTASVDATTGEWHYTVHDSGAVDALGAGETLGDSFTVRVSDNHGGYVDQLVSVTITGTNDAPLIDAANTTANGAVSEGDDNSSRSTSGVIAYSDVDATDSHSFALQGTAATYGTASVDTTTGEWHYTVHDSGAVDALAAGETLGDSFTVRVSDNQGGFVDQLVSVTITGTNDAPLIDTANTTASGGVSEGDDGSSRSTSGVIAYSDVDASDSHSFALQGTAATYGTASVDATTGEWHYTVHDSGAVDALGAGETLGDSFTVRVSDNHGGFVDQLVSVTITGTNDAPLIDAANTTASGGVSEGDDNSSRSTSGVIAYSDVDASDSHSFTLHGTPATYGSASVDADGTWHYTVSDSGAVDALAAGETLGDSFTVRVSDNHGGFVDQLVSVTITGTNDAPLIDAANTTASGAVSEGDDGSSRSTSGVIAYSDVDATDSHSFALQGTAATYGTASVDTTTGEWHYTVHDSGAVDALAAGETLGDSFTVRVSDNQGGFVDQLVSVTITGTNDAPLIDTANTTASGGVSEGDDNSSRSTSGVIAYSDVDASDSHSFALQGTAATYGTASVDADGTWHYTVHDSGAVDALGAGEILGDSFTVRVSDNHGGFVDQLISVTITGTNDAPLIDAANTTASGGVSEGDDGSSSRSTSGVIAYSDVDATDSHSFALHGTPATYGSASVDADGTWHYTVHDSGAVDALAAGETLGDSFTVRVSDNHGGYVDQLVSVTITGTNDAPLIDAANTTASGGVSEGDDNSSRSTSGVIAYSDVDASDSHSFALQGTAAAYGTASVDTTTGEWHYTVHDSGAVDALGAGETLGDSFTVRVSDNHGGYVDQLVSVTITGTNDAPQIDAANTTASGGVSEGDDNSSRSTSGVIAYSDVDATDSHSFALQGTAAAYGTASVDADGTWHYTVHDSGAVDALGAGETLGDSFTVRVSDNHGGYVDQLVSVTITGTNDAPLIDAANTTANGAVSEGDDNSSRSTSGVIAYSDVDASDSHSFALQGTAATYGTASVDTTTGEWHYTVHDSGAVDALGAGETLGD
ncbi:VCBS domain-containing protein, partial [Vogesella sp. LIG4]|uniref:VCBS domain-containing protein n=1 Tax=Vogesella sp. LIG4 TaxID=1192162 RepID=UPI00081F8A9F